MEPSAGAVLLTRQNGCYYVFKLPARVMVAGPLERDEALDLALRSGADVWREPGDDHGHAIGPPICLLRRR